MSEERCPDRPSGPHVPDLTTARLSLADGAVYPDVHCYYCGASGCFGKFTKDDEVEW